MDHIRHSYLHILLGSDVSFWDDDDLSRGIVPSHEMRHGSLSLRSPIVGSESQLCPQWAGSFIGVGESESVEEVGVKGCGRSRCGCGCGGERGGGVGRVGL